MANGDNANPLDLRAFGALAMPPNATPGATQIDPSLLPQVPLPKVTVQDLSGLLKGGPAIPQDVSSLNVSQNPDLANARGRIAQELQDPAVRQKLMASTQAEVGDQGAAAKLAYIESVMNRSIARQTSLDQTISDTSYYPDSTISRLGRQVPDKTQAELNGHIQNALAGSNLTNFSTGNESGKVRSGGAPITFNPGTGERFVLENADKGWQQTLGRVTYAQTTQPQAGTVADLMRRHGL